MSDEYDAKQYPRRKLGPWIWDSKAMTHTRYYLPGAGERAMPCIIVQSSAATAGGTVRQVTGRVYAWDGDFLDSHENDVEPGGTWGWTMMSCMVSAELSANADVGDVFAGLSNPRIQQVFAKHYANAYNEELLVKKSDEYAFHDRDGAWYDPAGVKHPLLQLDPPAPAHNPSLGHAKPDVHERVAAAVFKDEFVADWGKDNVRLEDRHDLRARRVKELEANFIPRDGLLRERTARAASADDRFKELLERSTPVPERPSYRPFRDSTREQDAGRYARIDDYTRINNTHTDTDNAIMAGSTGNTGTGQENPSVTAPTVRQTTGEIIGEGVEMGVSSAAIEIAAKRLLMQTGGDPTNEVAVHAMKMTIVLGIKHLALPMAGETLPKKEFVERRVDLALKGVTTTASYEASMEIMAMFGPLMKLLEVGGGELMGLIAEQKRDLASEIQAWEKKKNKEKV